MAPALSAGAILAVAALVGALLGRLPLNLYDVSFTLDWGSDVIHGLVPDVKVVGASTPHPLSIVFGSAAALFGTHALDVMRAVLLASAGATVLALYRLGTAACSAAVGLVSVLVLAVSEPFVSQTLGEATASDLPSLAALLAALAFEVARPRRALAPLVLLAIAGLWRPEPWLVSILYWLYATRGLGRRRRLTLGALALSAPAVWLLGDFIMTGHPLYSLIYTHDSAAAGHRITGLARLPGVLKETLTGYLGVPALIAAFAGVAIDLRRRRMARLLVVLALTVAGFAGVAVAGLPLDDRYALPTTALLAVYFGYFVAGWRTMPHGSARRLWMAGAAVAVAVVFLQAPGQVKAIDRDHTSFAAQSRAISDLQRLVRPARVKRAVAACGPVQASYRIVPLLAYEIGKRPRLITAAETVPARGSMLVPATRQAAELFETHLYPPAQFTGRGFTLAFSNASWNLYISCR